ncbi:MAG: ABC transporter permease [Microbacterium gubbeenense]|uniref:ABC transporter permease n=1 Tax=Microbacterium gubbeenense TaxID=159896 RepID=UPI0003FABBFB|nr:ABC transporter permease [Microbacterium gubbeenense]
MKARAALQKVLRQNEFYILLVIILLAIVIQARSGLFFSLDNIVALAGAMVVPGIFAVGTYMVLVSGGIDVSFPALASLAVYATTRMLVDWGWEGGLWLPLVLVIGISAVLGAFNGAFTATIAVPVLIITLGTSNVFSGFMQGALSSVQIPSIPPAMAEFGRASLLVTENPRTGHLSSLPLSFLVLVVIVAAAFVVMKYTTFGRSIYAIGGDESSAARAGVNVKRTKFALYIIAGVLAGIAGLVRTSMMGQMHPTNLLGMELMVIAAVVLGGTAITGGRGTLTGAMLGTLLIVIVQNSMILVGVPTIWQRVALGVLIIAGTAVSAVQMTRARKRQGAIV